MLFEEDDDMFEKQEEVLLNVVAVRKFGGDSLDELRRNHDAYRASLLQRP